MLNITDRTRCRPNET